MKKITGLLLLTLFSTVLFAQEDIQEEVLIDLDSIENSFTYQHGKISLKNGIGEISVPDGFKYLDPEQSEFVLVDLWGNPTSEDITLGLILPENQGILDDNGYVFNIQYDEIGYVEDDDADDIDYDELMEELKKDVVEENKERTELGYGSIKMIGWAANPYYDKDRKILHWAKEIQFEESEINTLNYNVRVLGRKGVLVLNAISSMPELSLVEKDIPQVLDIVKFNEGYRYEDFDSSTDSVAAWTIGGLVAGKILAKTGFFTLLLKFWKFIAIGAVAAFSFIIRKFKGSNKEDEDDTDV
ncbi:DUF2167 domain-containing protein [Flavobacterium arcticum]|uniref:DUF2167 domain-containing protein n=1 Tax=Flavobacterium arcticum TaxID=1784713 RepID=A0A345HDG2_9FLAO|nr:DUF2167 domain-containing protein [Flavobacterium arcticum]AXG74622.1 DUF2167 domain-containing protein [Flavobacterium arcticum]KAF2512254.1 DUF2167 domain-containing protein [Flavobacterium arcticum]